MGKTNRRKKSTPMQQPQSSMASGMRARAEEFRRKGETESFARMAFMDTLSFQGQKDTIRAALVGMGTDCDGNDADPTGNGDQSMILTLPQRDAAR